MTQSSISSSSIDQILSTPFSQPFYLFSQRRVSHQMAARRRSRLHEEPRRRRSCCNPRGAMAASGDDAARPAFAPSSRAPNVTRRRGRRSPRAAAARGLDWPGGLSASVARPASGQRLDGRRRRSPHVAASLAARAARPAAGNGASGRRARPHG